LIEILVSIYRVFLLPFSPCKQYSYSVVKRARRIFERYDISVVIFINFLN